MKDDLILAVVEVEVVGNARCNGGDVLFIGIEEDMGRCGEKELGERVNRLGVGAGAILLEGLGDCGDEVGGDIYALLGDIDVDVAAVEVIVGAAKVAVVDQAVDCSGDSARLEEQGGADVADGAGLVCADVEEDAPLCDVDPTGLSYVLVNRVVEHDEVIDPIEARPD